jgi:hypothetical protein
MALTLVKAEARSGSSHDPVDGSERTWYGTVTFDSSYPTGGEAIAAGDVGMKHIRAMEIVANAGAVGANGRSAQLSADTTKILLYSSATTSKTGVEVPAATDESATSFTVRFKGA